MDELTHLNFFKNVIKEIKNEFPELITQQKVESVVKTIFDFELNWAIGVYGKGLLGINVNTITDMMHYRVNLILNDIGFKSPYENRENPYVHLDKLGPIDEGNTKTGFFESRNSDYTSSTSMDGWEDI